MRIKIIIAYSFFVYKTVGRVDIGHHFESFTVATMTWLQLTVMKYLCRKWSWICSTCRKHFPALSSFMTYLSILIKKIAFKHIIKSKNKYGGYSISSHGFIVHIYYGYFSLKNVKYQTVIAFHDAFWYKMCAKISNSFQFWLKTNLCLSVQIS